jgi:Ca2+/Na+ antiporter
MHVLEVHSLDCRGDFMCTGDNTWYVLLLPSLLLLLLPDTHAPEVPSFVQAITLLHMLLLLLLLLQVTRQRKRSRTARHVAWLTPTCRTS